MASNKLIIDLVADVREEIASIEYAKGIEEKQRRILTAMVAIHKALEEIAAAIE
jgi:hypothetical protein